MKNTGRYQVTGDRIVSSHHRTLKSAISKAVSKAKENIGDRGKRIRVIDKETGQNVFNINVPKRHRPGLR